MAADPRTVHALQQHCERFGRRPKNRARSSARLSAIWPPTQEPCTLFSKTVSDLAADPRTVHTVQQDCQRFGRRPKNCARSSAKLWAIWPPTQEPCTLFSKTVSDLAADPRTVHALQQDSERFGGRPKNRARSSARLGAIWPPTQEPRTLFSKTVSDLAANPRTAHALQQDGEQCCRRPKNRACSSARL